MLGGVALILLLADFSKAQTSTYTVPPNPPASNISLILDQAPLGVSFEFFAFPGWQALESTQTCLGNIGLLSGALPPVRIGGTTQYVHCYEDLVTIGGADYVLPETVRSTIPNLTKQSITPSRLPSMLLQVLPTALPTLTSLRTMEATSPLVLIVGLPSLTTPS